jgi:flavin-dependent dehydrogenase
MNDPIDPVNFASLGNQAETARRCRVDVIVVGGGPAGCSTALALARVGFAVTVVERTRYERFRVGETLPPESRISLNALGVWEQFLADGHLQSPGIASAWGGSDLYDNDFIVNPYGPGWHLDRRRFDIMLAHAAMAAGVEVLRGARGITISHVAYPREGEAPAEPDWQAAGPEPPPPKCEKDRRFHYSSAAWLVGAVVDGRQMERRGNILVDATGRSSSIARRCGGRRVLYDRLIGLVCLVPSRSAPAASDRRTLIESVDCGWWYTAPLPQERRIVTFLTDADLVPAGRRQREEFWIEQLGKARHTRATLAGNSPDLGLRVVSSFSGRLEFTMQRSLVAVGDAVASFDPLSSQGIAWALESGIAAASAVEVFLHGRRQAIDDYARWVESEFRNYLVDRSAYYCAERRWNQSPFWARRHAEPIALREAQG